MIPSKRKRDGPSKLSLRSSQKHLSQTQSSSSLDSSEIVSQLPRSQPMDITLKDQAQYKPLPSKPVKIEDEQDLDIFGLKKASDVAIVDLSSSPEDVFKPSKSKRIKSAPTLGNLKTIPEITTDAASTPEIQVPPVISQKEDIKQINSERLAAKLKSFEKEPPKKFPISRHNSSETLKVAVPKLETPEEVKPPSPFKVSSSKPTLEEKELPCPVCNKPAGKNRRAHMKNCAGKNGLSTTQLLQAIELQQKQADERKELGLPHFLQQQQKAVIKKKNPSGVEKDPNIQLALALSKSIKDAEEEAFMRETRLLLENKDTFEGMTESQVDATIKAAIKDPSPAKKTTQTVLVPSESGRLQVTKALPKSSRPGPSSRPAPFMTASNEERLQRVTEKVAMYLLDEEGDTTVKKMEELKPVTLTKVVDNGVEMSSDLWKLASKSPSAASKSYYVKELQEFVSPSKSNSGLMHLEPVEPKFRPPPKPSSRKSTSNPRSKPASPAKKKESALSRDWASMLNSRTMSDVLVYAKEDRELRAHRLVLLVRCPSIVKELASEVNDEGTGVVEYMLLWSEYSYDVVISALEFIYCDTTCRAMKLNDVELNNLEALSQRYEINALEEHINLIKKLREDICAEDDPEENLQASPAKQNSPLKSPHQLNKSQVSEESDEDDIEKERTELSYLVSQMDKSTLLPQRKLTLDPETKPASVFIPLSNDTESLHEEEMNAPASPDIFASLEEESDFCKEILADNPEDSSPTKKSIHERTLTPADDWRNLDGLDYLQSSPSNLSTPRKVAICNSPIVICESPPLEHSPVALEVVTLSSDATSISQKSLSPRVASPTTPARVPLDDSLEVFEDGDLSRLEMAALKAYQKVMTPKAGPTAAVMLTPVGSAKVTPLADFSIMESPQLQKELDKFGIKKLRRNQAKLILRHIYNELHPVVASTPLARPQQKKTAAQNQKAKTQTQVDPKPSTSRQLTQKTVARKPSPKKKSSPSKSKVTKPHNLSMSQPEGYDSFDEMLFDKKVTSASQPAVQNLSDSNSDGYCEFEADEFLTEACTQVPETQTNISERIEEALKSDPGLYHRILTYEPIWLEEIKDLLKESKVKCNPTVLLDYLDDQCITYRHEHPRTSRPTQKKVWGQSQRGRKKKDF